MATNCTVDAAIDASAAKSTGLDGDSLPAIPDGFRVLTEGRARMLFPADDNEVFYNNAQIFNRDLSVMVAKLFLQGKRQEDEAKRPSLYSVTCERTHMWRSAKHANVTDVYMFSDYAVAKKAERRRQAGFAAAADSEPGPLVVRGARILDALSASGLRAVRYAKELDNLGLVLANDLVRAVHLHLSCVPFPIPLEKGLCQSCPAVCRTLQRLKQSHGISRSIKCVLPPTYALVFA
eukprot:SAG11_NODE_954_length_6397_cov_11.146237_4_plen_235_part_00